MADRTVYVGNVDAEVDEPTLRAVFENCGFVTQVRIAGKKGYNTVYCFIEFAEPSQAALALAMDGLQLGDRQIKVSMAKNADEKRDKSKLPPMNLLQAQAQARLLSLQNLQSLQPAFSFLPIQQTLAATRNPNAALFAAAAAAVSSAPLNTIPSSRPKRPQQDPDRVERTIYVENVAEDVDEQVLADHFGVCGEVTAVRVSGTGPGLKKAWVEFDDVRQARSAREYDQTGLGSAVIRVRPSKTAIHTNGLQDRRLPARRSPSADSHGFHNRSAIALRREEEFNSPSDRRRFQHSPNSSPDFRMREHQREREYEREHLRERDPRGDYEHPRDYEGVYGRDMKRLRT